MRYSPPAAGWLVLAARLLTGKRPFRRASGRHKGGPSHPASGSPTESLAALLPEYRPPGCQPWDRARICELNSGSMMRFARPLLGGQASGPMPVAMSQASLPDLGASTGHQVRYDPSLQLGAPRRASLTQLRVGAVSGKHDLQGMMWCSLAVRHRQVRIFLWWFTFGGATPLLDIYPTKRRAPARTASDTPGLFVVSSAVEQPFSAMLDAPA